jgi:F-type H+-transporting ATPase subunit gamma
MASTKEIRGKISSIGNTQKITSAMEMVATSKMRKAQDRMSKSRPYAQRIRAVIAHLAQSNSEYRHPYLTERPVKRVGYIIVSSDRGLCGGLNANLFRGTLKELKKHTENGIEIDLCLIGRKAESFFKTFGGHVVASKTHLGDAPSIEELIGVVSAMLSQYDEGRVDAIYISYNTFVNSMIQQPTIEQLLPLPSEQTEQLAMQRWDYIYEPDARELLNLLLKRYIESQVYQSVIENLACEQAATRMAMKNASDNAEELIKEFRLAYNKARQAVITQEIAEIVGGAAAV